MVAVIIITTTIAIIVTGSAIITIGVISLKFNFEAIDFKIIRIAVIATVFIIIIIIKKNQKYLFINLLEAMFIVLIRAPLKALNLFIRLELTAITVMGKENLS